MLSAFVKPLVTPATWLASSDRTRPWFERAVEDVAAVASRLLAELTTSAPPRDREVEAQKAKARAARRFG